MNVVRGLSPRLGTSLAFGRLLGLGPPELVLAFSKQGAFHRSIVAGSGRAQLEQMLSAHFGSPVRLRIEEASATTPLSPAEREALQKDVRDRELQAKARSHAAVQAALQVLGGEIEQIQLIEGDRSLPSQDSPDETS